MEPRIKGVDDVQTTDTPETWSAVKAEAVAFEHDRFAKFYRRKPAIDCLREVRGARLTRLLRMQRGH